MTASIEELERRVAALEKAQTDTTITMKWVVGTLGQVKAAVDHHTEVLAEHSATLASHSATLASHSAILTDHTKRLDRLEKKLDDHMRSFPVIVADTMREVLKEGGQR